MNNGTQFFTTLLLILIVLKTTGLTDLSWFWVLDPGWIPAVFLIILTVIMNIVVAVDKWKDRSK